MKSTRRWAWLALMVPLLASAEDPLDGAVLTVFDGRGSRVLAAESAREAPTLMVPGVDGPRSVRIEGDWSDSAGQGHVDASLGYRRDSLRWNIASSRSGRDTPNILSELSWHQHSAELRVGGEWVSHQGLSLKGEIAYAHAGPWGDVRDSDYAFDNRNGEWSRSYSKPGGGQSLDFTGSVGWKLPLAQGFGLTPRVGYARHTQDLSMRYGETVLWNQELAEKFVGGEGSTGTFAGLASSYKPRWWGPWAGLGLRLQPIPRLTLDAEVERHSFHYRAEADWNLRGDLAHPLSFRHEGHGSGWAANSVLAWQIQPGSAVTANFHWRHFRITDGTDEFFGAAGSPGETRLNEVRWLSWSAGLGFRHAF